MSPPPHRSTLFPYTTLFRSKVNLSKWFVRVQRFLCRRRLSRAPRSQTHLVEGRCLAFNWLTDSGLFFDEPAFEEMYYTRVDWSQLARRFTVSVEGLHISTRCDKGLDGFIVSVYDGFVEGGIATPGLHEIHFGSATKKMADDRTSSFVYCDPQRGSLKRPIICRNCASIKEEVSNICVIPVQRHHQWRKSIRVCCFWRLSKLNE